MPCDTVDVA